MLKELTTRTEIIAAIRMIPTFRINVHANNRIPFRFDIGRENRFTGRPDYYLAELRYDGTPNSNSTVTVDGQMIGISNIITYHDLDSYLKNASSPIVHNMEPVLLVLENTVNHMMKFVVVHMTTPPTSNDRCYIKEWGLPTRAKYISDMNKLIDATKFGCVGGFSI